jgi:hypothetical protein
MNPILYTRVEFDVSGATHPATQGAPRAVRALGSRFIGCARLFTLPSYDGPIEQSGNLGIEFVFRDSNTKLWSHVISTGGEALLPDVCGVTAERRHAELAGYRIHSVADTRAWRTVRVANGETVVLRCKYLSLYYGVTIEAAYLHVSLDVPLVFAEDGRELGSLHLTYKVPLSSLLWREVWGFMCGADDPLSSVLCVKPVQEQDGAFADLPPLSISVE